MTGHCDIHQPAIFRSGRLVVGGIVVDYRTLQPAPTQWAAIGLFTTSGVPRHLLVGAGRTEAAALFELHQRVDQHGAASRSDACAENRVEALTASTGVVP